MSNKKFAAAATIVVDALLTARVSSAGQSAVPLATPHLLPNAPIVDVAPGVSAFYAPMLTATAGTVVFSPGSPASVALTVTPSGNGSYTPGFAHFVAPGGIAEGYMALDGFNANDPEVFAFRLLVDGVEPTAAQVQQVVSDINSLALPPSPASSVSPAYDAFLGGQYDLLVTDSPVFFTKGEPNDLGFDFASETTVSGITVTDVAAFSAVPEPSSSLALLTALLATRRPARGPRPND